MKKQLISIGIVALFGSVWLSGCTNPLLSDTDRFIGTWKATNGSVSVLFSDGNCTVGGISGKWEIKDKMLIIVLANLPIQSTFSYVFSNGDRTVTLTDVATGSSSVYTKQ